MPGWESGMLSWGHLCFAKTTLVKKVAPRAEAEAIHKDTGIAEPGEQLKIGGVTPLYFAFWQWLYYSMSALCRTDLR